MNRLATTLTVKLKCFRVILKLKFWASRLRASSFLDFSFAAVRKFKSSLIHLQDPLTKFLELIWRTSLVLDHQWPFINTSLLILEGAWDQAPPLPQRSAVTNFHRPTLDALTELIADLKHRTVHRSLTAFFTLIRYRYHKGFSQWFRSWPSRSSTRRWCPHRCQPLIWTVEALGRSQPTESPGVKRQFLLKAWVKGVALNTYRQWICTAIRLHWLYLVCPFSKVCASFSLTVRLQVPQYADMCPL